MDSPPIMKVFNETESNNKMQSRYILNAPSEAQLNDTMQSSRILNTPNEIQSSDTMSSTPILQVSNEIIFMILNELQSPADRICFGLSCKRILGWLVSSPRFGDESLPEIFPLERYPILSPNINDRPRVQFLRRLENDSWTYCCDCWILHPKGSIPTDDSYCLHCQRLHGRECFGHGICMPHAGMVDLCPCLRISYRDLIHLTDTMTSALDANGGISNKNSVYYAGVLRGTESNWFQHECTFQDHPSVSLRVTTNLRLRIRSQIPTLIVLSRFDFELLEFPTNDPTPGIKSHSMCPHKDPGAWLRNFFDEAGSSFSGWKNWINPSKNSNILQLRSPKEENRHELRFRFQRRIGNWDWPSSAWDSQRR